MGTRRAGGNGTSPDGWRLALTVALAMLSGMALAALAEAAGASTRSGHGFEASSGATPDVVSARAAAKGKRRRSAGVELERARPNPVFSVPAPVEGEFIVARAQFRGMVPGEASSRGSRRGAGRRTSDLAVANRKRLKRGLTVVTVVQGGQIRSQSKGRKPPRRQGKSKRRKSQPKKGSGRKGGSRGRKRRRARSSATNLELTRTTDFVLMYQAKEEGPPAQKEGEGKADAGMDLLARGAQGKSRVQLQYRDGRRGRIRLTYMRMNLHSIDDQERFLRQSDCLNLDRAKSGYDVAELFGQVIANLDSLGGDDASEDKVFLGVESKTAAGAVVTEVLGLGCKKRDATGAKDVLDNGKLDDSFRPDVPAGTGTGGGAPGGGGSGGPTDQPPGSGGDGGGGPVPTLPGGPSPAPTSSPQAPSVVGNPSIEGIAREGSRLTCNPGQWEGAETFAYRWERDRATIAGATSQDYTPTSSDVYRKLRCVVTATRLGEHSAEAASEEVTVQSSGGGGGGGGNRCLLATYCQPMYLY